MRSFVVLIALASLAHPALAQTAEDTPASLSLRWMLRGYQDGEGRNHSMPGPGLQLSVPIARRLRFEGSFDSALGGPNSLSNLDLGLAYRLGELDPSSQDPLNNLHVAMTWAVFNSSIDRDGSPLRLRDEGLGVGLTRLASPDQEFSYYYRLMLHPSLGSHSRNLLGGQALLAEAGLTWRLQETVQLDLGYRYRSHKHNGSEDTRLSKEHGPYLGFRLNF